MDKKSFAVFSDAPIKVEYFNAKTPITMASFHYHNQYELYYSIKGERYYFIKDKCYALKTGSMVFINEYDIHYTAARANSSYERMVINFKKDFLQDVFSSCDIDLFACFKKDINIIEFDARFLEKAAKDSKYKFNKEMEDTLVISRVVLPQLRRYKLNDLADHFGIEFLHHRALSDARATAEIFLELKKLENNNK